MLKFERIPIKDKDFKDNFPGWHAIINKVKEKVFSFKDVNKYTGLTKNQIAYFIREGVLESEDSRKWRRFSLLDLFILSVAKKLNARGVEVAALPLKKGKMMVIADNYTEPFVYIFNGYDAFFYTDSEGSAGFVLEDVIYHDDVSKSNEDLKQKGYIPVKVTCFCQRMTTAFTCVSLGNILKDLAEKIDLPDFKVTIQEEGKYQFVINGIPLKLESLKVTDEKNDLEEYYKKLLKKEDQ